MDGIEMYDKEIDEMIIQSGYINNSHLRRRQILTQMFRHKNNFDDYFIKNKPYHYVWSTTVNELSMQCRCKPDERKLRFKLFGKKTVIAMLESYETQSGINLDMFIQRAKRANNSKRLLDTVSIFMSKYGVKKHFDKPVEWINSFKAIGAYYTIEGLIKIYECTNIRTESDEIQTTSIDDALSYLSNCATKPDTLFATMNDFIIINSQRIQDTILNKDFNGHVLYNR